MKISEAIQQAVPELTKIFAEWWNSKGKNQVDLEDPDTRQTAENYIGYVKDKSLLFDETAVQTSSDWESFLWNAYTNRQEKGPIEGEIVFGSTSFSAEEPDEEQEIPDFTPSVPQTLPEAETPQEPAEPEALPEEPQAEPEMIPEEEQIEETPEPEPEDLPEEEPQPLPEEEDEEPAEQQADEQENPDIPKEDVFEFVDRMQPEIEGTTEEPQAQASGDVPSTEEPGEAAQPEEAQEEIPEAGTTDVPAEDEPAEEEVQETPQPEEKPVDIPAEKPHVVSECVQQFLFSDEEMGIVRKKAAEKLSGLPVARHHAFDDALFALQSGLKVNLYGPAGSGRHTLAQQLREECGSEPKVGETRESGYANFLVDYDPELEAKVCPKAHQLAENLRAAGTEVLLAQCIVIEKLLPLGEQKAVSAI